MSREAMQLALEALELYQSRMCVQMFDEAVKALRQALAEPGNSVAGELAREWTYGALKEIRDAIRARSKQ